MPSPMTAGLAPNIVLQGGYIVRVTALDPDTGDTVTDVIVSDVALQVATPERDPEPDTPPPFVPMFTYAETTV